MRNRFVTGFTLLFITLFVRLDQNRSVLAGSSYIYANSASTSNGSACPWVYKLDPATMAVLDTYTSLSGGSGCSYGRGGRGIVVISGILYYTNADSNTVWKYDTSSHTNQGAAFTVAAAAGLSAIASDGTNFWIGDYSGTNRAYLYAPNGTLLKTITLANCGGNCDGLEYFIQSGQARLISNRGDGVGPYDVYDTNGTLLTPAFVNPTGASVTNVQTGISYDGAFFYTSEINNAKIDKWNGTSGAFIGTTSVTGYQPSYAPYIEDLSADYAVVLAAPATAAGAPALSTGALALCAILLLLLGGQRLRRRASNT